MGIVIILLHLAISEPTQAHQCSVNSGSIYFIGTNESAVLIFLCSPCGAYQ